MYFLGRKTIKIYIENTFWGRQRLDRQGLDQRWTVPPIQEKIGTARPLI